MSDRLNKSVLGALEDFSASWYFTIPVTGTIDETSGKLLELLDTVFECCRPFMRLQACHINANWYPRDIPVEQVLNHEQSEHVERRLTSEDGIEMSDIEAAITDLRAERDDTLHLRTIDIDQAATRIRLEGFDGYLDRSNTDRYRPADLGGIREGVPRTDPLTIHLKTISPLPETDNPTEIEVQLVTVSDIWFEDTDVAAKNRERLADALACLHTDLPDGPRTLVGDRHGEATFREVPHTRPLAPWMDFDD